MWSRVNKEKTRNFFDDIINNLIIVHTIRSSTEEQLFFAVFSSIEKKKKKRKLLEVSVARAMNNCGVARWLSWTAMMMMILRKRNVTEKKSKYLEKYNMAKNDISKSYLKRNCLYIVILVLLFEYVYTRFFRRNYNKRVTNGGGEEDEETRKRCKEAIVGDNKIKRWNRVKWQHRGMEDLMRVKEEIYNVFQSENDW